MKNWRSVPVPARMQGLHRDRRGYPIPDLIVIGDDGAPVFTANDVRKVWHHLEHNLCGICAQEIEEGQFHFVGGPASAFHPQGAYVDGPVHHECGTYALQVCPYIAMPNYTRGVPQEVTLSRMPEGTKSVDPTMMPGRPECFVMIRVQSFNYSYPRSMHSRYFPVGDGFAPEGSSMARMLDFEVWKDGQRIEDERQAVSMLRSAMRAAMQQVAEE